MTRYDLYVSRQVFFECGKLWSFAGSLTTDDGTELGCFECTLEGIWAEASGFDPHIHGPNCATTLSMTPASTLYRM